MGEVIDFESRKIENIECKIETIDYKGIVDSIVARDATQAKFLDACREELDPDDYMDLLESICCFEKYMYADEYTKNLTALYLGLQSTVG